jgi:hypothetical protein
MQRFPRQLLARSEFGKYRQHVQTSLGGAISAIVVCSRVIAFGLTMETGMAGDEVKAVELYDLQDNPEENVNVAGEPNNKAVLARLSEQLALVWKTAKPK